MSDPVLRIRPQGFPWHTTDPFLFCVYHDDAYPAGNDELGPNASLEGRLIGQDFAGKDGWRMYHGERVPGFPGHPHRGFETVTIVRRGVIDHADSLGATARFGKGDVQWLTAGAGIQHSEMFPLLEKERENPLELFQIWLNLPRQNKLVQPYFSMFWEEQMPVVESRDAQGNVCRVTLIAGSLADQKAPSPPPDSWAAREDAALAIWIVALSPGATWTLPAAAAGLGRSLYFYRGNELKAGEHRVPVRARVELVSDQELTLVNGAEPAELLLLQARPIGEPVAQEGPFVMNTRSEILEAFADYRRTRFGGWPWKNEQPVHAREETRFARYPDGRVERPQTR